MISAIEARKLKQEMMEERNLPKDIKGIKKLFRKKGK